MFFVESLHFSKKNFFFFLFFLISLLIPRALFANESREIFRIEILFEPGAPVIARDTAEKKYIIGHVNKLPTTTRWPSYTASAWGKEGEVCASAVNAIHMLVSVEKGKGRTMSIIPQETIAPAAGAGASLVISTKAGNGLFGAWAPPAGTNVYVKKPGGAAALLGPKNLPKRGDLLRIPVYEKDLPYYVEFENRPGGRIIAWHQGDITQIGRVIKPVGGVGRFEGTLFQRQSALRANHPGVIDISTSEAGLIGGFQIMPWDHALTSKEMQHAWNATQWMILGPIDGKSKMGGTYPLFGNGLVPGPFEGEVLWDIWATYGRKSLILARTKGGDWQYVPPAAGKSDDALKEVTHLRIYYPITEEPLNRK